MRIDDSAEQRERFFAQDKDIRKRKMSALLFNASKLSRDYDYVIKSFMLEYDRFIDLVYSGTISRYDSDRIQGSQKSYPSVLWLERGEKLDAINKDFAYIICDLATILNQIKTSILDCVTIPLEERFAVLLYISQINGKSQLINYQQIKRYIDRLSEVIYFPDIYPDTIDDIDISKSDCKLTNREGFDLIYAINGKEYRFS